MHEGSKEMTDIMLGSEVQIIDASDPGVVGLNGTILDETKNMLSVQTKRGIIHVPKVYTKLRLHTSEKIIQDSDMRGRFYERIRGP